MSTRTIHAAGVSDPHESPAPALRPKEHGAYAILGVPLLTALVINGVDPVAMLVAIAAVAGFLANEPLLVILGHRGSRAKRTAVTAPRALVWRTGVAVACGAAAFVLGDADVRVGLLLCLVIAALQMLQASLGSARTLNAQLFGVAGLTLPGSVVLLSGPAELELAVVFWMIWMIGHAATTVAVRSTIATHKKTLGHRIPLVNDVLLIAVTTLFLIGSWWNLPGWMASLPLIIAAIVVRLVLPSPMHLKRVGWGLVIANVIAGIWMIVAFAG